jgi:hypothetical protein
MESISQETIKNGWENETGGFSMAITHFIKNNLSSGKYDSLTELHLSGHNSQVLVQIHQGEVTPTEVSVYYKNNTPESIKVRYDNQGVGHDIDIFINGDALHDLLSLMETSSNE